MSAVRVRLTPFHHVLRQLKLVVPGGVITYYLGTVHEFVQVIEGLGGSWGRTTAATALASGLITITLFVYILLVPWIKGVEPDYQSWRKSGILSSVIPILTGTIVAGSLLLVLTLGQWSNLGYLRGIIGAAALYTLAFGLLGLIPARRAKHK